MRAYLVQEQIEAVAAAYRLTGGRRHARRPAFYGLTFPGWPLLRSRTD